MRPGTLTGGTRILASLGSRSIPRGTALHEAIRPSGAKCSFPLSVPLPLESLPKGSTSQFFQSNKAKVRVGTVGRAVVAVTVVQYRPVDPLYKLISQRSGEARRHGGASIAILVDHPHPTPPHPGVNPPSPFLRHGRTRCLVLLVVAQASITVDRHPPQAALLGYLQSTTTLKSAFLQTTILPLIPLTFSSLQALLAYRVGTDRTGGTYPGADPPTRRDPCKLPYTIDPSRSGHDLSFPAMGIQAYLVHPALSLMLLSPAAPSPGCLPPRQLRCTNRLVSRLGLWLSGSRADASNTRGGMGDEDEG